MTTSHVSSPAWPRLQVADDLHKCFSIRIALTLNHRARRALVKTLIGRDVHAKLAEYLGVMNTDPEMVERHLYDLLTLIPRPDFHELWTRLRTLWLGKDVVYCLPDEVPATLPQDLRALLRRKGALRAGVMATIPAYREGTPDLAHIAWAPPYSGYGLFRAAVSDLEREDAVLQAAARWHRERRSGGLESVVAHGIA
jgi:hypothetical protein